MTQSSAIVPQATNAQTGVDQPGLERVYRSLRLIRRVEEEVARIYPTDRIKSPVHLSIGQEGASVGVCDVLRHDDAISGTYRSHAAFLAKGGSVRAMMAELYGKATGVAGGKGGSMHLIDMSNNILGTSAVVGTTVPIALGFAHAFKQSKSSRIVAAYFGDGATEEGVFAESLNYASLKKLPVLFVCENNHYAIHTPVTKRWATQRLCERVETYGIPVHRLEGNDVLALRDIAEAATGRIRAGGGPEFIECVTYRWREHVGPNEDFDAGYRPRSELLPWLKDDPVEQVGVMLKADRRIAIDTDIETEIADAIAFAESSPFPNAEELYADVYAGN